MTDHTPTPWKASLARTLVHITNSQRGITSISIAPPKGSTAAERKEHRERALADATFIVTAANCHDDLVSALEPLAMAARMQAEEAHINAKVQEGAVREATLARAARWQSLHDDAAAIFARLVDK